MNYLLTWLCAAHSQLTYPLVDLVTLDSQKYFVFDMRLALNQTFDIRVPENGMLQITNTSDARLYVRSK